MRKSERVGLGWVMGVLSYCDLGRFFPSDCWVWFCGSESLCSRRKREVGLETYFKLYTVINSILITITILELISYI